MTGECTSVALPLRDQRYRELVQTELVSSLQVKAIHEHMRHTSAMARVTDNHESKVCVQVHKLGIQLVSSACSTVEWLAESRSVVVLKSHSSWIGILLVIVFLACVSILLFILCGMLACLRPRQSFRASPLLAKRQPQSPLLDGRDEEPKPSNSGCQAAHDNVVDNLYPGIYAEHKTLYFMSASIARDPKTLTELTIYGAGGAPIMSCSMNSTAGLPEVSIYWCMGRSNGPLASCTRSQDRGLDIRDMGGRTWATLVPQERRYVLSRQGVTACVLDGAVLDGSGITVSDKGGKELAHTGVEQIAEEDVSLGGSFSGRDHVMKVYVNGGVDTLLVLLCVVSVLYFGSDLRET